MEDPILKETTALVREPFELQAAEPADEAELLAILSDRVEEMLANRPEYLMSMLYRLDVLEHKIMQAMHPGAKDPAHIGIAKLVLERQRQRAFTKKNIKSEPLKDMSDWEW